MAKENYMIGLTDAQKRATMCLDDIQDVCIKHKLNLTILDDGIGFVDQKENKVVMVWHPKFKPIQPETPPTQKPSGGNMAAFIYGTPKGGGRFVGNRKKHTIRGMKKK